MPQVCLWLYLQTCSQAFSCPLDFLSILNVTKSQGGIWGVPQNCLDTENSRSYGRARIICIELAIALI